MAFFQKLLLAFTLAAEVAPPGRAGVRSVSSTAEDRGGHQPAPRAPAMPNPPPSAGRHRLLHVSSSGHRPQGVPKAPPQPAGARQGSQGTGSPPPPPTLGAATRCQHLLGVLEVSGCFLAKGCAGSSLDPVLPSAQQQLEEPQSPFHSTELSK